MTPGSEPVLMPSIVSLCVAAVWQLQQFNTAATLNAMTTHNYNFHFYNNYDCREDMHECVHFHDELPRQLWTRVRWTHRPDPLEREEHTQHHTHSERYQVPTRGLFLIFFPVASSLPNGNPSKPAPESDP